MVDEGCQFKLVVAKCLVVDCLHIRKLVQPIPALPLLAFASCCMNVATGGRANRLTTAFASLTASFDCFVPCSCTDVLATASYEVLAMQSLQSFLAFSVMIGATSVEK